jgi:hypothetical protein
MAGKWGAPAPGMIGLIPKGIFRQTKSRRADSAESGVCDR